MNIENGSAGTAESTITVKVGYVDTIEVRERPERFTNDPTHSSFLTEYGLRVTMLSDGRRVYTSQEENAVTYPVDNKIGMEC